MLQIPPNERLAYISAVIEEENIRFPGATFAKETGQDSGNISKMLSGDLAVSDKFFTAFLQHHPNTPASWEAAHQPMPQGNLKRTLQDYVEQIEGENKFLRGLVNSALSDIAVSIKSAVEQRLNSGVAEVPPGKKKPIVDPKALNPEVPVPSHRTPEAIRDANKGTGQKNVKGKSSKQ